MKTLAVWTLKGGVGKTAAAVNLADAAARGGCRTLLWDLDPQGAASFYLRVTPELPGGVRSLVKKSRQLHRLVVPSELDNLWLLPADFSSRHLDLELDGAKKGTRRLARKLEPLAGRFDLAVLDCPPSVSLVSEAVLHAADVLLVPVIPSPLAMRALEQVLDFAARKGPAGLVILPFFCLVDLRRKLHREVVALKDLPGARVLKSAIPYASIVEQMGTHLAPLATYAPSSPAAEAYVALWREVVRRTGRARGRR